jgi:formylglycine-generating enzyme required for sulfatase activity
MARARTANANTVNALDLLLPATLLVALVGLVGLEIGVVAPPRFGSAIASPATTIVAPRSYTYRDTGAFQRPDGRTIDGPLVAAAAPAPLEIMTYQVTVGDYARCVADGACDAPQQRNIAADHPVTGVSFDDAIDYATWLSAATGETWRLPTVAEWVFAAAEQAVDPAIGATGDSDNPAEAWIEAYEREAALARGETSDPGPVGSHGSNSLGLADVAGPVWEWTATCDGRTTLDAAGNIVSRIQSCGVRLLEGQHRAPMSGFIRDARSGGCSTGRPPEALGFRLVREPGFIERLTTGAGRLFGLA